MDRDCLKSWPEDWPPPEAFLGPLLPLISSWQINSSSTEPQIIVRFQNHYGFKLTRNPLNSSLYLVIILKFSGATHQKYDTVFDSHLPELNYCFTSDEVFRICEKVAGWK